MTKRILSFCLSVLILVSMMSVCGLVMPVMAAAEEATLITMTHNGEIIMAGEQYNYTYVAEGLTAGTTYRVRAYSASLSSWITPTGSDAVADANGTVTFSLQELSLAEADDWKFVLHPIVDGAYGDGVWYNGGWLHVGVKARAGMYVDVTADASVADGTEAAPYATISAAIAAINAEGYTGARVISVEKSSVDGWTGASSPDLATSLDSWTEPITLRSPSSGTTIWFSSSNINTKGPLCFEHTIIGYATNTGVMNILTGLHAVTFNNYKTTNTQTINIFHGYNADTSGVTSEELKSLDMNFTLSDLNLAAGTTINNLSFGGSGSNTGSATMKNANIVIDDGDVTIAKLIIGSYSNKWVANSPNNIFTGNFNLTVNDVAGITEIANADNGSKRVGVYNAMQFLFNNGIGDGITVPTYGTAVSSSGYARGGHWVVRSEKKDGCYLEMTDTAGVYTVYGGKIATATDGTNTYVSANGVLTIPTAGDYTVTYSDPNGVYFDNKNGSDENDGLTESSAVATLQKAVEILEAQGLTGENRVITVVNSEWSGTNLDFSSCTAWDEMITIRAKNATATLWTTGYNIVLNGPMTFDIIVGDSANQSHVYFHTRGYELVLGERFINTYYTTKAANTIIYMGYDHAREGLTPDDSGYIQFGHDIGLTIEGENEYSVTINFGNVSDVGNPVQYGNANLYLNNPNLTVKLLDIGNKESYVNTSGVATQHTRFDRFTFRVDQVAAIDMMTVNSHNHSVYSQWMEVLFNNGTWDKVAATNGFSWHCGFGANGFHSYYHYVMMNDATDGSYLEFTETPGTFNVVGELPATAANATAKRTSEDGTLTMAVTGVYDVSYYQVVYVDAVNGLDTNDGLSASTALQTIPAALDKVNALGLTGDARTVYVLQMVWDTETGTAMSSDFTACATYTEPITIRGKNASDTLWYSGYEVLMTGPVIYDHIRVGQAGNNTTLKIYANGHALKFTETATLARAITVYAGVYNTYMDKSGGLGELVANKTLKGGTMHFEFLGSVVETGAIEDLILGGYDNVTDPKAFVYDNVYVMIDCPELTIGRLFLGCNQTFNAAAYDGRFPNNHIAGDVVLTVNNVSALSAITFATWQNGMWIEGDLQLTFNNGIGDGLTIPNYRDVDYAAINGEQWVLRSVADDADCYLVATDAKNTYRVVGNKVAVATDGTATYRSVNGVLTVPAGDYTVTYEAVGEYTFTGDTLTAITDIASLDISALAPVQDGNRILLGWTLADGTPVADVANVTLSAGETLKAVYGEFNASYESGNADFYIEGVQMRATNKQGLRFIITKGTNFDARFEAVSGVKYGYVLLPKQLLNGELTIDTVNALKKDNADRSFIHLDENNDCYSVCLTNIAEAYYNTVYVARGYTTYTDMNGVERTVYTEQYACSLFEAAALTLTEADADRITLDDTQRGRVQAVLNTHLNNVEDKRTETAQNVADSLQNNVSGKIYYISPNGDDSNDGWHEPWQSIARLNEALEDGTIVSGDVVLFERGGEYRIQMNGISEGYGIQAKVSGVSYGAYGTGAKPIINGSVKNYAGEWIQDPNNDKLWTVTLTNVPDIYVDPGVIVLNGGEAVGARKKNVASVTANFDYSYSYNESALTGTVTMYYDGDLNTFTSVEIGTDQRLLNMSSPADAEEADWVSNIVVENLDFRYSGGFGVRGSNNKNVIVRGCEFQYIGGSYGDASDEVDYETNTDANPTRYGNAVEFMNSSSDVLIENCYIKEIYDSGVTFQGGASSAMYVENFTVRGCVIINCGMGSFEYWMGNAGEARNILLENNYMEGAGCGWGGEQRPNRQTSGHIRSDGATRVYDFVIQNNVFNGTNYAADPQSHLLITDSWFKLYPELIRNVYVDSQEASLGYQRYNFALCQKDTYTYDENARETLKNEYGAKAPIVIFTESLA